MKIAHIVCTYPPYFGGMGNSVYALAEAQVQLGHDVTVYTPETSQEAVVESTATIARVAPSLAYGNGGFFPTITRELDQFDVVHLQYPFFGVAGKVKRWKQRHPHIPLVTTYHMDPRGTGVLGWYMQWYARYYLPKILQVSDALIGSTFDFIAASEARNSFVTTPERWHEIPFGVDTDRFHPDAYSKQLRYSLDAVHCPLVLFVGGMDAAHHFKGIPLLLRAIRNVARDQQIRLVLVGDGNERAAFEAEAMLLGISNRVTFVGRVPDDILPMYYATADCTVLPSTNQAEAFGMVLLESLASGTPVIASDLPGVRRIAALGGHTVPSGDVDQLAHLLRSVQPPTDRQALRARVSHTYVWDRIAADTIAVYQQVSVPQ